METKQMTAKDRAELKRLLQEYGLVAVSEVIVEATQEGYELEGQDAEEREKRGEELRCSFCGKRRDQVANLIAGARVYICDECVDLCNLIMAKT